MHYPLSWASDLKLYKGQGLKANCIIMPSGPAVISRINDMAATTTYSTVASNRNGKAKNTDIGVYPPKNKETTNVHI